VSIYEFAVNCSLDGKKWSACVCQTISYEDNVIDITGEDDPNFDCEDVEYDIALKRMESFVSDAQKALAMLRSRSVIYGEETLTYEEWKTARTYICSTCKERRRLASRMPNLTEETVMECGRCQNVRQNVGGDKL
jgi:hypothetical protein